MTRAAVLLALILSFIAPAAAQACMLPPPGPGERMAEDWATVAVVTVLEVESRAPERPNRAWSAQARISRVVEGAPRIDRLRLWHEELTECPEVLPLPVAGEAWVIYLEGRIGEGGLAPWAWPLSWAERLDPRFGGRADADISDLEPPQP